MRFPVGLTLALPCAALSALPRYNTLLLGVARQLADLKKAVKGLVVVTPELEEISQALLQGKVRRAEPVSMD